MCRKANRAPPNVSSTLKYPFDYMLSVLTVNSNLFPDFSVCRLKHKQYKLMSFVSGPYGNILIKTKPYLKY